MALASLAETIEPGILEAGRTAALNASAWRLERIFEDVRE